MVGGPLVPLKFVVGTCKGMPKKTLEYTICHRLGASRGFSNKNKPVLSPLFNGP